MQSGLALVSHATNVAVDGFRLVISQHCKFMRIDEVIYDVID